MKYDDIVRLQPKEMFIEDTTHLLDHIDTPPMLMENNLAAEGRSGIYSCNFCGVGDNGFITSKKSTKSFGVAQLKTGDISLKVFVNGQFLESPAVIFPGGLIEVSTHVEIVKSGRMINAEIIYPDDKVSIFLKNIDLSLIYI